MFDVFFPQLLSFEMRTTFSFLAKVLGKSKIFPSIVLTSKRVPHNEGEGGALPPLLGKKVFDLFSACPCCRSPNSKMIQPRGNATYDDKNGVEIIGGSGSTGFRSTASAEGCGRVTTRPGNSEHRTLLREPFPFFWGCHGRKKFIARRWAKK